MPQPISLGTVLGGRYIVLDEVVTTPEQDHVLGGKDQILGREVTILVPSEAHTSRVVENARTMAIGAVDADLQILDLGQSGATPYLVTSFAAPAVLLEGLLAEPGAVEDDTLSDDIFGRPRSSSSSGSYVLDDGEPETAAYEETEVVYDGWADDITSAPAAPKVAKHLGRTKRAPESSTRATLFDRAAARRGTPSPQRSQALPARGIDPSYDGDNRYDSFEYEYEKTQKSAAVRAGAGAGSRRPGGSGRDRTTAGTASPAGSSSASSAADRPAGRTSSGRGLGLGLLLLLLLLALLVGAGVVFGGLGRMFDSVTSIGGPSVGDEPSASATPTQEPPAPPVSVVRLVPDSPTLMAEQDATLGQAIDGDPATEWYSFGFTDPNFGQLASSVALGVRLEEPSAMNQVTVTQSGGTGGSFTVYVADTPSLEGAQEVGQGTFDGPQVTVDLDDAAAQEDHAYVILQWTELPLLDQPIGGNPYGLRIAEIDVS